MDLATQPYGAQASRWPERGRHILAKYDDRSIVVYQAYRPAIGRWATAHGTLGGPDFSLGRMSWIKPGFLWMMYRSGWATKADQEVILAIRLVREGFDAILREAVPSAWAEGGPFPARDAWQAALAGSSVRLQWDPDHHPSGAKLARRAIQLGLRGDALRRYVDEWIVSVDDVTAFVVEQRAHVLAGRLDCLLTPREDVYQVNDAVVAARIGLTPP